MVSGRPFAAAGVVGSSAASACVAAEICTRPAQGDGAASCQVKQALVTRPWGERLPPASDAVIGLPQHCAESARSCSVRPSSSSSLSSTGGSIKEG